MKTFNKATGQKVCHDRRPAATPIATLTSPVASLIPAMPPPVTLSACCSRLHSLSGKRSFKWRTRDIWIDATRRDTARQLSDASLRWLRCCCLSPRPGRLTADSCPVARIGQNVEPSFPLPPSASTPAPSLR